MTCSVFIPLDMPTEKSIFTLLYLSGLTCTDENVCQKSGIFHSLSEHRMALIAPDTSPRGANIQGESDSWDFGIGAGFYLDAIQEPWTQNYNMYSYVTIELFSAIEAHFPELILNKVGITGHSMGGHGALTIAFKNPQRFKSVSAFAPICNPTQSTWGIKAFSGYLGPSSSTDPLPDAWTQYDASILLPRASGHFDNILIDVGLEDSFLKQGQLRPEALEEAARSCGQTLTLRYQEGFDHSYYFVSSFVSGHVLFHYQRLSSGSP